MDISKTVKRLEDGTIWICKKILNKLPKISEHHLFEFQKLTEKKLEKEMTSTKLDMSWELEKGLKLEDYITNFHIFYPDAILPPAKNVSLRVYNASRHIAKSKKEINILNGKKSVLTRRKNNIQDGLIKYCSSETYREYLFPYKLLCLYEVYKEHCDQLEAMINKCKTSLEKAEIEYQTALTEEKSY